MIDMSVSHCLAQYCLCSNQYSQCKQSQFHFICTVQFISAFHPLYTSIPFIMGRGGTLWDVVAHWLSRLSAEGRGFDSRTSRHIWTLGKSFYLFTYSCLC